MFQLKDVDSYKLEECYLQLKLADACIKRYAEV